MNGQLEQYGNKEGAGPKRRRGERSFSLHRVRRLADDVDGCKKTLASSTYVVDACDIERKSSSFSFLPVTERTQRERQFSHSL